jgi:thiamine-monophosphate kinase
LRGLASAALDVSDGLVADLAHIAEVSGVRIEVEAGRIPLSAELVALHGNHASLIAEAATAGDDYEIAFTTPASLRERVKKAAFETNTRVTEIGQVIAGEGVALVDEKGREIKLQRSGYTHF